MEIQAGQDIKQYHIIEKLGSGGMANVFRCYDTRLEREVAVKFIRSEIVQPQILKRFEREGKALARMEHPNIVSVLEYGEYEDVPYLVMPYILGGTLKETMGQPIPYQKAIEMLYPVAQALEYAHQQGVVHRDVKPANILVTEENKPMLSDFGIAKLLEAEGSTYLTGTGVGIGTPEYMSPEQAHGENVDLRSDIYSLGIILYEMVTGRLPFTADTPLAVIIKQINDPLPRPKQFIPELPDTVEQILFKALAKEPKNRFENMRELLTALDKVRAGETDLGFKVEVTPKKHRRGFPLAWGILGLVVLVILGVVFGPGLLVRPESTAATQAPTPTEILNTPTQQPTKPEIRQVMPTPVPTSIPLKWERLANERFLQPDIVSAIAVSLKDPDVIYAGTQNAGIYRTLNGGLSWEPASQGLEATNIFSLIMDPTDPLVLYTGVLNRGVFKTIDGGEHWKDINVGIDYKEGDNENAEVLMDPLDHLHLYYAHRFGIYESHNGGTSWEPIETKLPNVDLTDIEIHPLNGNVLIASFSDSHLRTGGIFRSDDGGKTWISLGLDAYVYRISVDRVSGNTITANVELDSEWFVYSTTDGGENWKELGRNSCTMALQPVEKPLLYCFTPGSLLFIYSPQTGGLVSQSNLPGYPNNISSSTWDSVYILPGNPKVIFAGDKGLYKSSDSGVSWKAISVGLGGPFHDLVIAPQNSSVFYTQEGKCPNEGISKTRLFRSTNGGKDWALIDAQGCRLATGAVKGLLYRSLFNENQVMVSIDGGTTWENRIKSLPTKQTYGLFSHPTQPEILFANDEFDIYRTIDGGKSWEKSEQPQENFDVRLYFPPSDSEVIYAYGSFWGFRSIDGGKTWNDCQKGYREQLPVSNTALIINPNNKNILFAATRGAGVMVSKNGCQNWKPTNTGLGSLFVNSVAIDPANPQTIYAGTDGGFYASYDSGETWGAINDGLLGALAVYSIAIDPVDSGNVYAATPYGIFKLINK